MRVYAVINMNAGTVLSYASSQEFQEEVRNVFDDKGIDVQWNFGKGEELADIMDRAGQSGADILLAGGGDGTIRHAARTAMQENMALAVLPLGTINLFARDLGMPMDWKKAVEVIARNSRKQVDTARMNGKVFLCQSTVGLVPRLAEEREGLRDETWWRSLVSIPSRFRRSILQLRRRRLRISMEEEFHETQTWLAVVTNNRPDNAFALMPQRTSLDKGVLTVHWANVATRVGIFWLVFSYVLNIMKFNPQVEIHQCRRADIQDSDRQLKVDLDGEVLQTTPPLEYRISPLSLTVLYNDKKSQQGG